MAAVAVISVVALVGGVALCGMLVGNSIGVTGGGRSVGSSWTWVPVGGSGSGKRVRAGGVFLTSSGVSATGDSGSGCRLATASRGEDGAVGVVEGGKLVVVCAVGLKVRLVCASVEQVSVLVVWLLVLPVFQQGGRVCHCQKIAREGSHQGVSYGTDAEGRSWSTLVRHLCI